MTISRLSLSHHTHSHKHCTHSIKKGYETDLQEISLKQCVQRDFAGVSLVRALSGVFWNAPSQIAMRLHLAVRVAICDDAFTIVSLLNILMNVRTQ